jgi:hypothetical protein
MMLALNPMSGIQRLTLLVVAAALLFVTFELIRKRRLREEYAVLWVCTGVMILVVAILPDILFIVAGWLKLSPEVMMTLFVILFLASIVLHYSAVITKISDRMKGLTQELAFMRDEMERLRGELKEAQRTQVDPKPKPPSLRT